MRALSRAIEATMIRVVEVEVTPSLRRPVATKIGPGLTRAGLDTENLTPEPAH